MFLKINKWIKALTPISCALTGIDDIINVCVVQRSVKAAPPNTTSQHQCGAHIDCGLNLQTHTHTHTRTQLCCGYKVCHHPKHAQRSQRAMEASPVLLLCIVLTCSGGFHDDFILLQCLSRLKCINNNLFLLLCDLLSLDHPGRKHEG